MGADAIGFILALLAMGLTMVAIRARNILISVGTASLWAALLAYFVQNSSAAANFHPIFIIAAVGFMIAMLFLGIGRGRSYSSDEEKPTSIIRNITKQFKGSDYEPPPSREESTLEYRDKVRKALNRGKKGKGR